MEASLTEKDFIILYSALDAYKKWMKGKFQETGDHEFREELVTSSYLENKIREFLEETEKNDGNPASVPIFNVEHVSACLGALESYQVALVILMRNEPESEQEKLHHMRESTIKLLHLFSQTGIQSKNLLELYSD